jgi:mono/diheme cytochrome c family protein
MAQQTTFFGAYLRANLLLLSATVFVAVADEPEQTEPKQTPEHAAAMAKGLGIFKKEVKDVLVNRCLYCHGDGEIESGLDLSTRGKLLKGGVSGASIKPGQPDESWLMRMVRHQEKPGMPLEDDKLSDSQIAALAKWIELGAPYDAPLIEQKNADPLAWTKSSIRAGAKQHWAFQPLQKVSPPEVQNAWLSNDIDKFIWQKLSEQKFAPNPRADRRTLIRRIYLDVVGLPPTPEEVQAFVEDKDPDAYEKLVDKLLASPHFGERWARHWLDVARFAESHGFEQDYDRPFAFHYRDFVIRALNEDMPFDQFVRWQLAGDEFAPDNPLAMMATGFLGAGVFPTQITKNEVERTRYDALDDMAATTGTAMLGLTVGCARCHDHKFDPIPQADYYRFASTFTTTVRSNIELNLDPNYPAKLAEWEKTHQPLQDAVKKYEAEQLPEKFANWREAMKAQTDVSESQAAWHTLDLLEMKSAGGATLTKQPDGAVLATGKNAAFDTYTFTATTSLKNITGIKLEALADKSMVRGGPGRASNGNFALTDFAVVSQPMRDGKPNGKPATLEFSAATATFEQAPQNLFVRYTIDDDAKSGWAVDPQFGKDHAAAYTLKTPLITDGEVQLTFTLKFNGNTGHNIGRTRLSVTGAAAPALDLKAGNPVHLLAREYEKLTPTEKDQLLAWYKSQDKEYAELQRKLAASTTKKPQPEKTQVMVASEGYKPIRHHTQGADFFKETYYLARGDCEQKAGVAESGFLQVVTDRSGAEPGPVISQQTQWWESPPEGSQFSYRRRALANWITDTERGPGQLLARVGVNRIWQHHFGVGLVSTPNDFGTQGEPPSHPELLDWLAAELIDGGWKTKRLHKLILMSSAYTQSSDANAEAGPESREKLDPQNRLLWRFAPRRLEAEIIRDSLLSVSGQLDERMFGKGTLDDGQKRRSIYFMIKRSKLIPMLQIFDMPEPLVSVGERPTTTIAPQALLLMNNVHVRNYATALADKLIAATDGSAEQVADRGYKVAVGRAPTAEELASSVKFIQQQTAFHKEASRGDAAKIATADFAQVLFCLNEFAYMP